MARLRIGPTSRMLSPSCGSTLITSAPSSARIWVANGPITTVVRSRIRTPDRGPGIVLLRLFRLDSGGAHEFTSVAQELPPPRHACACHPSSGRRGVLQCGSPPCQGGVARKRRGGCCNHERTTRLGFSSYGGE